MFFDGMRVRAAIVMFLGLAALATSARGQVPVPEVKVVPLARSAAFSFRLDEMAPTLYVKEDYGSFYAPDPVATLEWRVPGEEAWKKAQPFVRVQSDRFAGATPDPRMATMLFGLREGAPYEYRVAFTREGFPTSPIVGRFTTLTADPPVGPKTTVVTVSEASTSATLRNAIKAAYAGGADHVEIQSANGPGVKTLVRAAPSSIYHGGQFNWSGTETAWKKLSVAKGHDIVFDGSLAEYDVVNGGKWKPYTDTARGIKASHGVYVSATSITKPGTIRYERPGEDVGILAFDINRGEKWDGGTSSGIEPTASSGIVSVAGAKGSREMVVTTADWTMLSNGHSVTIIGTTDSRCHGTFTVARASNTLPSGPFNIVVLRDTALDSNVSATGGTAKPEGLFSTMLDRAARNGAAWVWLPDAMSATTGKVYLRLHDATDPNTVRVKIPALSSMLDLGECHHVVIDGLHIAYSGGWTGGIGLIGVDDIVIRNNRIVGTGMFVGSRTSGSSRKNRVVLKGNTFENRGQGPDADTTLPVPVWSWSKASKQELIGIPIRGVGVAILDNTIKGAFNGVSNYAGVMSTTNQAVFNTYAEATEVDGNAFYGIGDDAIEPEQWCVNQAYTRNTFTACYKGISCAPVIGGPMFILRNTWLGRGEFAGVSDKQAFLKMGNDDPGDPAYKYIAHNTIVNINVDQGGIPLVGIANSGSTYNHYYYNNYVASDGYPVDMGYGVMGYPHIFDGNRYRSQRFAKAISGYDHGFALGRIAITQGEIMPGSDHRNSATFADWQRGRSVNGSPNWPGYDGNIPMTPRLAPTPGTTRAPAETVAWLHDPNSTFSEGAPELMAPFSGDFRPQSGTPLVDGGMALANLSFDCGPAWAAYEEAGRPTVGAVPAAGSGPRPNDPPTVTVDSTVTTVTDTPISVTVTSSDPDGRIESLTASVNDPASAVVTSRIQAIGDGVSSVVFTPTLAGLHTVKVTVRDDKGATAEDTATVEVKAVVPDDPGDPGDPEDPGVPGEPLEGQLVVTMTASKSDPKPGEPVVYTIQVANPTDRAMREAVVRQNLPKEMTVNIASLSLDGRAVVGTFVDGVLQVSVGDVGPGRQCTITLTAFVK